MDKSIELLPLLEYFQRDLSHMTWEGVTQAARNYARANLAELQREVEGLRAERDMYKDADESMQQAHYEALTRAREAEARADRLEEALRDLEVCANTVDHCYTRNPGNFAVALRELRESAERSRDCVRPSHFTIYNSERSSK